MGRQQELARQNRRRRKSERALAPRISAWMKRRARLELNDALESLKSGKLKLNKASSTKLDEELLKLLSDFGIRQMSGSGSEFTLAADGGQWAVPPKLIDRVIKLKAIRVTRLSRNIRDRVLEEIRRVMVAANKMEPKPSVGQIARTLREKFSPDAKKPIWALDPKRAALIARSEAQQNEQTGLFEGAEAVGAEAKEWISSGNPNHGDRAHQRMDGQQRLMGDKFKNPTTGDELMYPGDPSAPIRSTANCGCGMKIIRMKDFKGTKG